LKKQESLRDFKRKPLSTTVAISADEKTTTSPIASTEKATSLRALVTDLQTPTRSLFDYRVVYADGKSATWTEKALSEVASLVAAIPWPREEQEAAFIVLWRDGDEALAGFRSAWCAAGKDKEKPPASKRF
jgi:hypothetical protein